MLRFVLDGSGAVSVFYEFAAAFPSISQEYMLSILAKIGVPECAQRLVTWLYDDNRCQINFKGRLYPGFDMRSGVRQGCPLSPVLYVLAADLLLFLLQVLLLLLLLPLPVLLPLLYG